ncbi:MAG: recombinase family protein [Dehalococcoidia bacterium]|nr:recombinase family protein [Dehalococcoidia bacterium]
MPSKSRLLSGHAAASTATILAVGYFRVSTPNQAKQDRASLPTQRAEFLRHCERFGYTPAGEYVDVMTGAREDRPEWQRLFRDAASGAFQRIVVYDATRFGRDDRRAVYEMLRMEIEHGVTLDFIRGRHRTLSDIVEDFEDGAKERRRLGQRVTDNLIALRRGGKVLGKPALGYTLEGGVLTVDEAEAAIVRDIFDLYLRGNLGALLIARRLNDRGLRTKLGSLWSTTAVLRVLSNTTYEGRLQWRSRDPETGEPVTGVIEVPSILPPGTVARCNERRRVKKELTAPRGQQSTYLLSPLLYCAHCERRMTGTVQGPKAYRHRYYLCSSYKSSQACRPNQVSASKLEARVIAELSTRIGSIDLVRADREDEKRVAEVALQAARAHQDKVLNRLARNNDRLDDDEITRAIWEVEHRRIEADLRAASTRVDAALDAFREAKQRSERAEKTVAAWRQLRGEVGQMPPPEAKAVLQGFISRVSFSKYDDLVRVDIR